VGVNQTKIVGIYRMTESFVRGSLSFYVDMLSRNTLKEEGRKKISSHLVRNRCKIGLFQINFLYLHYKIHYMQ